ncbi:hypothetical protein NC651_017195 [Populus alba x Populus x berolinensis]|nr:hypothetical protein NC651_017195 [Populus alba x Populus x berolinensis]
MRRGISSLKSLGFVKKSTISNKIFSIALRFHSNSPPSLLENYKNLVEQGKVEHDPYQERVAFELEKLLSRLQQYEKDMEDYYVKLAEWEEKREEERLKLLVKEAKEKQETGGGGIWTSVNKQRNRILEKFAIFGKKGAEIEPGVGRWVSYLNRERKLDSLVGRRPIVPPAPKGLYIYGNVGSGKTMLMDMFYSATEGMVKHRRRFHFHEAMLNINAHMHKIWKNQVEGKSLQSNISSWIINLPFDMKVKEWLAAEERYKQDVQMKNILLAVADEFLMDQQAHERGASILCFDEIQVENLVASCRMFRQSVVNFLQISTWIAYLDFSNKSNMGVLKTVDVFAIVALSGILSRLLTTGTVLVATSNRAPRELNQDGMQRDIFQKLVSKLEEHCEIILIGSEIDYRRFIAQRSNDQANYFWPLESSALKEFEKMWCQVTNQLGGQITSETIPVMFGRVLDVPESCNGVTKFTFEDLCGRTVWKLPFILSAPLSSSCCLI